MTDPTQIAASLPAASGTEITVIGVMRRWKSEGAHWTSDLAHGANLPTAVVRKALHSMERKGLVRRAVSGNPSSWEINDDR